MAGGYECLHVPLKGAGGLMKNPIVLGGGGLGGLLVVATVGVWPIIAIGGFLTFAIIGIFFLQVKSMNNPRNHSISHRSVHLPQEEIPDCKRHPGIPATTILNVTRGSNSVRLPLCAACLPEAQLWLKQKQLTSG